VAWLEKKTGPVAVDVNDVASGDKLLADKVTVLPISIFLAAKFWTIFLSYNFG
jgi:hypothetical protein